VGLGVTYGVRTSSIAPWKRMVDFLFPIIEHFSLALTVQTSYADIGQNRRFSKKCHFKRMFQMEGNITHQPLSVSENQSDYPFMRYQKIVSMFFRFVTKHACDGRTNGQADRPNYDPQHLASIAASRGNKHHVARVSRKE